MLRKLMYALGSCGHMVIYLTVQNRKAFFEPEIAKGTIKSVFNFVT